LLYSHFYGICDTAKASMPARCAKK
jgi:hypothetical protein